MNAERIRAAADCADFYVRHYKHRDMEQALAAAIRARKEEL